MPGNIREPDDCHYDGETMILWGLDLALTIVGRTRVLITIVLLGWLFRAQVVKLRPLGFLIEPDVACTLLGLGVVGVISSPRRIEIAVWM